MIGLYGRLCTCSLSDVICYGANLCAGCAFTNDKEIRGCIINRAKIYLNYFLTFNVCDRIDDQLIQLIWRIFDGVCCLLINQYVYELMVLLVQSYAV